MQATVAATGKICLSLGLEVIVLHLVSTDRTETRVRVTESAGPACLVIGRRQGATQGQPDSKSGTQCETLTRRPRVLQV